MYVYKIDTYTD